MSRDLKPYNLPGFGVIRPRLFNNAETVYDFMDRAGYIDRLERVDQLGTLRNVYPGAHHSRLEYVMAQLAIITEICQLSGPQVSGIGLSSDAPGFTGIAGAAGPPSYGEVLQMAVILLNVGHLPNTFSAERAMMSFLESWDQASLRSAFRGGLASADRDLFDDIMGRRSVYRFHVLLALFLLRRYRRRADGHEVCRIGTEVLRSYVDGTDPSGDRDLKFLWRFYRSIRRFTYLTLDALYTPVPFSLDLSSMMLSLRSEGASAFDPESVFQRALEGLERVMRDAVYLSAEALLQHARASDRIRAGLQALEAEGTIGYLRELVGATQANQEVFGTVDTSPTVEATARRTIVLDYEVPTEMDVRPIVDTMAWERETRSRIGYRSCRFGAEWDPTGTHLRVAAGVGAYLASNVEQRVAYRIGRELVSFDQKAQSELQGDPVAWWPNHKALMRFLCAAAFGWHRQFRFRPAPLRRSRGIVIADGSSNAGRIVAEAIARDSTMEGIDADTRHEFDIAVAALKTMQHRGRVLVFLGGVEVLSEERALAEFDTLVFRFLTQRPYGSCVVVEAKNVPNGNTVAKAQLETRLSELGWSIDREDMTDLGSGGAFAELRWN